MKSLQEDIRQKEFKNVYLFYGEEAYLKQVYKKRMKEALLPDGDEMNFTFFEGKKTEPQEVIQMAQTMPFFAERRVIFLENTGFFKGQCESLPEYLSQLPEYLCMIFIEEEVDKRSRMYKAVKKSGRIVEFAKQDSDMLIRWIFGILNKEQKKITRNDMELFLTKTGTDMGNIEKELEKLLCYVLERDVITRADIEAVCTSQVSNHIFDMLRAVTEKKQQKALDLYYDLLALKEPPMRILYLLARQFNCILQVKESLMRGNANAQIAREMGVAPFIVGKYAAQAKYFESAQIKEALRDFAETEEAVKTGKIEDKLGVELMIIKYSQK